MRRRLAMVALLGVALSGSGSAKALPVIPPQVCVSLNGFPVCEPAGGSPTIANIALTVLPGPPATIGISGNVGAVTIPAQVIRVRYQVGLRTFVGLEGNVAGLPLFVGNTGAHVSCPNSIVLFHDGESVVPNTQITVRWLPIPAVGVKVSGACTIGTCCP